MTDPSPLWPRIGRWTFNRPVFLKGARFYGLVTRWFAVGVVLRRRRAAANGQSAILTAHMTKPKPGGGETARED